MNERYLITKGEGRMETSDGLKKKVVKGDIVFIPEGCRQRIANTGTGYLEFYCICTPRFKPESYKEA